MGEKNAWSNIETALVVVDFENLDGLKAYRDVIRDAGLNVNNCALLAIVEDKKRREALSGNTLAVFVSEKDFNVFGQLKNELAQKIFKRKFDLIVTIGDKPKKISKMLTRTAKKLTVGINCTKNEQDVNLKTASESPAQLINFAKNTLEKIN